MVETSTIHYIHPPNLLRNKVGKGGLPQDTIDDAQSIITETRIDIRPYLREQLNMFQQGINRADVETLDFYTKLNHILNPLAMLKAHASMFGYDLISEIAEIALEFTQHLRSLDPHVLHLLARHHETMQTILNNNIRGNGGEEGYKLALNLYAATQDYARQQRHPFS
jgi:hypothetical protein